MKIKICSNRNFYDKINNDFAAINCRAMIAILLSRHDDFWVHFFSKNNPRD